MSGVGRAPLEHARTQSTWGRRRRRRSGVLEGVEVTTKGCRVRSHADRSLSCRSCVRIRTP
jgi:hypothetical protein